MNKVHRISNILEHASEGHEQVAMLVTFQEAGGENNSRDRAVDVYLRISLLI